MCPCISSRDKYAVCSRCESGLMVPSIFQRDNYCFEAYELCPLFYNFRIRQEQKNMVNEPSEIVI
jgi:hypothetical protein